MIDYYRLGGSLKYDHRTYVSRKADKLLINNLRRGNYCFLFSSRQVGKSSLKVKAIKELRKLGNLQCASTDISAIEISNINFMQWFYSFGCQILRSLKIHRKIDFKTWWDEHKSLSVSQSLEIFFTEIVLKQVSEDKIIIFIDEVDSLINFDFKDDFFALIRYFYNYRSENSEYERLTFCLIGVTTLSDLIDDKTRTPFNIGTSIELTGFEFEEAKNALVAGLEGLGESPEELLKEILLWTGGQPFLTQKLCQLVVENYEANGLSVEENVKQIVQTHMINNWDNPNQDSPQHFRTIRDRLLSQESKIPSLLGTYQQVLQEENTTEKVGVDRSDIIDTLRLSGIVVKKENGLEVYNPIYREIFNQDWVKRQLDEIRPYSKQINQWFEKNKNSSYLLEGEALKSAQEWANPNKRSIGDRDREYLERSERKQNEIREGILKGARNKAYKIVGIAFISSIIAVISSSLYAAKQFNKAQISDLENQGNKIAAEFDRNQISGLISGLKASDRLNKFTNQSATLADYPTYSPIDNLYSILSNISQRNILEGHNEKIEKVAYSSDGKFFASADRSGIIKLWDIETQQELSELKTDKSVVELDFSPDNKQLMSVDRGGNLKIWDLASPESEPISKTLFATINNTNPYIFAADFSSNGKTVAVVSKNGKVAIWNIRNLKSLPIVEKDYRSEYGVSVYAVAYSPDGQNLALGDSNRNIVIWDLLDDKTILKSKAHNTQIKSIVYSSDGKQIVSSSADGVIQLRDDGGELLDTSISPARGQSNLVFSPDSQILAVGSNNGVVELFDTRDRSLKSEKDLLNSRDKAVNSLAFSPNGEFLVTGGMDRKIRLWQLQNNLVPQIKAHSGWVNSLSLSEDNSLLVSAGSDGNIVLWQTIANTLSNKQYPNAKTSSVNLQPYQQILEQKCDRKITRDISINPANNNQIACGGVEGKIKIYNLQETKLSKSKEISIGVRGNINRLSYSPDGKSILVVTEPSGLSRVTLWSTDGSLLQEFTNDDFSDKSDMKVKASFDPTGKTIVVSRGRSIQIWDIKGNLIKTLTSHEDEVTSISFNAQGNLLVSGDVGGKIKLWNLQGEELQSFSSAGEFEIADVTFSPDSKTIVAADKSGKINLWQRNKANKVSFMFALEENNAIKDIQFTRDSKTLIVGKADGSLSFWDLDLDIAIAKGCFWLKDYLAINPDTKLEACDRQ